MTLPRWPAGLPQRVLADGYEETMGDGRVRTPMDQGPPKVGRAISAVGDVLMANFRVTLDQKELCKRFCREDLKSGTLPFILPAQAIDGAPLATGTGALLTTETGRPVLITAVWVVMLGESMPRFRPTQRGMAWIGSVPLVIIP